eukprot:COSAG02_NODE_31503_length_532_cov_1.265589_1_plen_41_part_10
MCKVFSEHRSETTVCPVCHAFQYVPALDPWGHIEVESQSRG